jgi:hypothetical protein
MVNNMKIEFNGSRHVTKNNTPFSDLPQFLILTKDNNADVSPENHVKNFSTIHQQMLKMIS